MFKTMISCKNYVIFIPMLSLICSSLMANSFKEDEIAHQLDQHVQDVIDQYFTDCKMNEISITPLKGGYSATSFVLTNSEKKYVLRLMNESESINRIQAELYAMKCAGNYGIAPKIYWVADNGYAVLMDFIPGGTLKISDSKREETIIKIAELCRKVHSLPKNPYVLSTFEEHMNALYLIQLEKTVNPRNFQLALQIIQQGSDQLKALHSPSVCIHGDLNPRNIITTNDRIFFIDWSEGMYTDPFHDLAYYSILLDYQIEEETLLLNHYLERIASQEEMARFLIAKKMNFARLALGAQYVADMLLSHAKEKQTLNVNSHHEWSYFVQAFSNNEENLTIEFFLELSELALKIANSLQTSS